MIVSTPRPLPGAAEPPPSFRRRLRQGSGDRHERLDGRFAGLHEAAEPALYHRFIRVNHACHRAIGEVLGAAGPLRAAGMAGEDLSRCTMDLSADMEAMGLAPLAPPPFPIPAPDLAEAVGIAYVLEGSLLGARYIHRALTARPLGEAWKGVSLRYLAAADGPDTFRAFMEDASGRVGSQAGRDRSVAAANATFDYFLQAVLAAEAEDRAGGIAS